MIFSGLSLNEMRNCTNSSNNASIQFDLLKLKTKMMKIENHIYLFVSHHRIATLRVHHLRAHARAQYLLFRRLY